LTVIDKILQKLLTVYSLVQNSIVVKRMLDN
jgi:hypothetical protein